MSEDSEPVFGGSRFTRAAFAEALATFYFGPPRTEDSLGRYIDRAYRDMNRTLRLAPLNASSRKALRAGATKVLSDALTHLVSHEHGLSVQTFDAWHREACDALKETYATAGIGLTYGQAQKWVNMTLKYLFVALALDIAGPIALKPYYAFAHLPIDGIVVKALKARSFSSTLPRARWSRHDDYGAYLAFQESIRAHFGSGLDAEMMLWRPHYETWGA